MNIKVRAAALTAGILICIFLGAQFATWLGDTFTADQIFLGISVLFCALMVVIMYNLILTRLEYEARIKEIANSYNKQ